MSINISKIQDEKYRKLAESIDKEKEGRQGYNNGYLDSTEVSIFCAKVNESLSEEKKVKTFFDLAELLGFKKRDNAKANTRYDYNLVNDLPKQTDKVTADNVVYLLTEYKNKNGKYCETPVILAKLEERAKSLGITIDDENKKVEILVEKIKEATDNTYFVEEATEDGVSKVVHMGDAELSISETYYDNGKVVLTHNGKKANGTTNSLVTKPENKIVSKRGVEEEPIAIKVVLPKDASENAQKMAIALTDNKAKLMEFLKIDNETYDKYVSFTLALIERETNFGEGCVGYDEDEQKFKEDRAKYAGQMVLAQDDLLATLIRFGFDLVDDPVSFGMSSIKYDIIHESANSNKPEAKLYKDVLDGFKKFDINSQKDLYEPENCAIATLIYASKQAEIIKVLCENDSNNSRKLTGNYDLESRVEASPKADNATEFDVVANMWNRGAGFILDGALDINWEHTKTVRENMKKYIVLNEYKIAQMQERIENKYILRNVKP